tara:strand:+ start:2198 stop:2719 length:522 start_codon:yes stop_codon:yes gene_type:complete
MNHFYLCHKKISKQLGLTKRGNEYEHSIETQNNNTFLWPKAHNRKSISPETYATLKEKHKIVKLTIVDRIKAKEIIAHATDHINKTGKNYLIGATPYKEKPTFPDVSAVYSKSEGDVFISYGKRFEEDKTKEAGGVQSEWMAVIATVWKYVGVEIVGIGVGNKINSLKNLNNE